MVRLALALMFGFAATALPGVYPGQGEAASQETPTPPPSPSPGGPTPPRDCERPPQPVA